MLSEALALAGGGFDGGLGVNFGGAEDAALLPAAFGVNLTVGLDPRLGACLGSGGRLGASLGSGGLRGL